jgi:hypothetical protein
LAAGKFGFRGHFKSERSGLDFSRAHVLGNDDAPWCNLAFKQLEGNRNCSFTK